MQASRERDESKRIPAKAACPVGHSASETAAVAQTTSHVYSLIFYDPVGRSIGGVAAKAFDHGTLKSQAINGVECVDNQPPSV